MLLINKFETFQIKKLTEFLLNTSRDSIYFQLKPLILAQILLIKQQVLPQFIFQGSDSFEDILTVNANFQSKLKKIKCFPKKEFKVNIQFNSQKIEENSNQNEKDEEELLIYRNYQLDACIVKIMKFRKILDFNQLTSEVLK